LKREGLTRGSYLLPWSDVGSVVLGDPFLVVLIRGTNLRFFRRHLAVVSNFDVFLGLLKERLPPEKFVFLVRHLRQQFDETVSGAFPASRRDDARPRR